MRRHVRFRWMAERPHTTAALRQATATGRRSGLTIRREWYESGGCGALSRPPPHPELQRRRSEGEVLPNTAFEVAEVRRRERAAGEQCERRRVRRTLGCVEHS